MLHKQRITVLLFIMSFLMLCVYIMGGYISFGSCYIVSFDILNMSTNTFEWSIVLDKTSLSFSALVCMISACVFMFAREYMSLDLFYWRFIWVLLSFVISMNILVLAGSLFMLLLGWDGLGISSFALIIYYQSGESLGSGFLTLLINRIGDVLIMSTMFYLVVCGSGLLLNFLNSAMPYMIMLFCLAALTKSAQYPFSAWLPAAMAAPTPVSALVHSSTLVTAGIYIMIRLFTTMTPSTTVYSILLFCGSITSLMGGVCALYENDLKKVVAFSTLSQLGIMVFSLGLGSYSLALLHLYTHAMFKAMLFMVAGCILIMSFGTQDIRLLGAVTKDNPFLLIFLNTSTFCLMGLPFLSAYYSKHSILCVMLTSKINILAMAIMMVAVVLTSGYMIRLIKALNWGPRHLPIRTALLPLRMYFSMVPLYVGAVSLGWVFAKMDIFTYTFAMFIPIELDILMYLLLLLGSLMGVFLSKSGGLSIMFNMFYMDPLWKQSNYLSYILAGQAKNLEVGWVEPYTTLSSVWVRLRNHMYQIQWSKSSLSFTAYAVIMAAMYWSWYLLK